MSARKSRGNWNGLSNNYWPGKPTTVPALGPSQPHTHAAPLIATPYYSDQLTLEKIRDNLQRPLRPAWIAPEYPRPWSTTSELPDFTCTMPYTNNTACCARTHALFLCIVDATFVSREGGGMVTPLVLVSTAHVSLVEDPQYIQGAGDDEESWAMGLTPALFWDHHDHILEYASQDTVEERIREVVARDKQRRTQGLAELTAGGEGAAQQLHWIGRTGIAVADDVHVLVRPEVHVLVNSFEPHTSHAQAHPHHRRTRTGTEAVRPGDQLRRCGLAGSRGPTRHDLPTRSSAGKLYATRHTTHDRD